jgi:hypothetical protein
MTNTGKQNKGKLLFFLNFADMSKRRKIAGKSQRRLSLDRSGWIHWFPYDHPEWLPDVLLDVVVDYDGRRFHESPEQLSKLCPPFLLPIDRECLSMHIDHHARGVKIRETIDDIMWSTFYHSFDEKVHELMYCPVEVQLFGIEVERSLEIRFSDSEYNWGKVDKVRCDLEPKVKEYMNKYGYPIVLEDTD